MAFPPAASCPRCGAPRVPGTECPRCGVIYAKARPPRSVPVPEPAEVPPPAAFETVGDARGTAVLGQEPATWGGDVEDAHRELLVQAIALPAALLISWALVSSGVGHMLVRTFLSMWVHELGHAVAAWWSGYGAFPGPWRTLVSSGRVPFVIVALTAGLLALGWRGWRKRQPALIAAAAVGLALQLVCTLLPGAAARALFSFGGDAGCMVLGAALAATIWADPEGPLGRGWLRWGFLVIGACSLVDALATWIAASHDFGQLPLGEIEGVGLSDASKLVDVHGWSIRALTGRYVTLGLVCLAGLSVGYAIHLVRARQSLRAARQAGEGRAEQG